MSVFSILFLFSSLLTPVLATEQVGQPISFRSDVALIFLENCVACHGPKKAEGGYRIDTFDELLKPGDSGEMPVVAASAASG